MLEILFSARSVPYLGPASVTPPGGSVTPFFIGAYKSASAPIPVLWLYIMGWSHSHSMTRWGSSSQLHPTWPRPALVWLREAHYLSRMRSTK